MKAILKGRKWKPEAIIPADVDPVKLADKIKGNMTTEWLKRYNRYFKPRVHLAKRC